MHEWYTAKEEKYTIHARHVRIHPAGSDIGVIVSKDIKDKESLQGESVDVIMIHRRHKSMSDDIFESITVGGRYPQWIHPGPLVQIHFRDSYWELVVGFPDITPEEVQELHYGSVQVAAVVLNRCLFFLFKFGRIPWCDAPYDPRIDSRDRAFLSFRPGEGAPLALIIVDTNTGEVKGMRMMGLSNLLSNRVHRLCRNLQVLPFDDEEYKAALNQVYQKYPTSESMLKKVNPKDITMILKR